MLQEKGERQGQLIGSKMIESHPEIIEECSNNILESIKAKLFILEKLNVK